MKYIVFSDLHAHEFTEFAKPDDEYINSRLANIVNAVKDILVLLERKGAQFYLLVTYSTLEALLGLKYLTLSLKYFKKTQISQLL